MGKNLDVLGIHDCATGDLVAVSAPVVGTDLVAISRAGVQYQATVAQITTGEGAVTLVTGTAPIISSGGATPAISIAASALVSGAAGAESLVIGNNVIKRGSVSAVAADAAAATVVTFGAPFATGVDAIQLTVRSTNSSTNKVIVARPDGAAVSASAISIKVYGGDAASTAVVDWTVWGH